MRPFTALFLMGGLALAQSSVMTSEQVVASIAAAREEILLSATVIASNQVQQALREAALQRGVLVFVLVDEATVWTPASYAPSLAITDQMRVNVTARAQDGATLVIDRTLVIEGPLAAGQEGVRDPLTRSVSDPDLALARVRRFVLNWNESFPLLVTESDIRRLLEVP